VNFNDLSYEGFHTKNRLTTQEFLFIPVLIQRPAVSELVQEYITVLCVTVLPC
jgi:hypothetical protein